MGKAAPHRFCKEIDTRAEAVEVLPVAHPLRKPLLSRFFIVALAVPGVLPAQTWTVDLNARLRVESREHTYTFNRNVSSVTDDSWYLTRVRLGLKGELAPDWTSYVQVQDSREFDSERSRVPYISGSEGNDPADLRLAYVEHKTGDAVWRVGRQLLAFGDERLVGVSEWSNFARDFDAVRVTWPKWGGTVDAFVSSVVQTQPGGSTGWHSNHSSQHDLFGGIYVRLAPTPTLKLEPYLLGRNSRKDLVYNAGPAGSSRPYDIPQKILTAGLRLVGGPPDKLGGFEYDAEIAGQTGEARGRQLVAGVLVYPGPAWLAHRAWAWHAGAGYSWSATPVPLRLYAEVNRASGDRNPTDGHNDSFLNLFPTNHRPYGLIDVFSWKNMRELALTGSSTIAGAKVRLEQHWFALDNVNDTWFRSNGVTAVRPLTAAARQAPRRVGAETDFVVSRPFGKHILLEVGCGYFATGPYVSATGGASDARFGYLQSTYQW